MKIAGDRSLFINKYELTEKLYKGDKTEVYRALRLADKRAIVIKILRQEYPTFSELLHFRNQYTIAKNLQSCGIVRPLSLETYRNSYALVMEDFGGISLREYTQTRSLKLLEFLEISLQLADILHELYQNRTIHKDIKPANILIHPETQQVNLRTFSRADKNYKVPFNIHEGIDSTILILKHRLKANEYRPAIEVLTEYGNLPLVECFPGQLNQVFMNILANAIDAVDESSIGRSFAEIQAHPNQIIIQTSGDERQVQISIADNGIGMSEAIKNQVFEHLFTTKAVGKGTGLGLAIARQIVEEKHGGIINVKSILGAGTEFTIQIPLLPNDRN